MGQELYIVTSATDVLTVYKESEKLSFDAIIKSILGDFGCTDITIEKIFQRPEGSSKTWMDVCHTDFKIQMHPGEKLDVMQAKFLGNINHWLQWDRITGPHVLSDSQGFKRVSLWKWCGNVLVDSATKTFFGSAIYRVSPTIVADFFPFDGEAWKLPYRYPEFAAKTLYESKRKAEATFAKYLSLPREERQDASWVVQKIEQGMAEMGITESTQCAAMLLTVHRVVNSNAYRLCFWMLAHLLFDEALLATIKTEIRPAFDASDDTLDMNYLLDDCPRLASLYEEILRTVNDPIGARLVTQQVTVGGKTLQPGARLLMPYKQLHYDPEVFGPNAAGFDPERFLRNKNLLRSNSWRPFGGGTTLCPGRFLARREVYMFVALLLFRFDIQLAPSPKGPIQKFPTLDDSIPSGGILGPVSGHDVILEVRPSVRV
ncbi:cytochrome P450 [Cladorrhinum sp. PSN259]|nr:cytochrome P450 [Cladorrhinum sp. PSN259]